MESIWSKSCELGKCAPLSGDIEADVAVIGAGMAGILTAYTLQRAGLRVAVLEANRTASGQTRNTTAKITSQHGLIYQSLAQNLGADKAAQYGAANEAAIEEYRRIIQSENIDCDFEAKDAYLYGSDTEQLRSEAEIAAALGLPASFVGAVPAPVSAAGAVKFSNQAQFNPLKFIKAVSEKLTIYENTPVITVKDGLVQTPGGTVSAEKVVFACHYPFVNFPGLYFARMHQERSYVLALENAGQIDGMFIGADSGSLSLRSYKNLILLGGEAHRTGENSKGGRYAALRQKAAELFPGSREVAYWSAQDCITPDMAPYIGNYAPSKPDWFVATGFHKWGMTSSMVSAMLLSDLICGNENSFAEVFDPNRVDTQDISGIARESGQTVKGLTRYLFKIPSEVAEQLQPGHGGVVFLDGEKVGVYKDESGVLHAVSVRCPHLGCELEWNPDEKSWDCPCHGSRFDYLGGLISGPAQENLSYWQQ